ncbi:vWA domain-containing protein [Maritimibacter dapengensis]|uniref:VWA domain-containing protein n=1 Tax=Maritimibacter dapengensis TaxID=2836868 RepID=A0ABS6T2Z3_9RHOB|nr:VWA domain-containing protein [Maritimibacter dapengensis]MBV7379633.1 VWA domain-containing protein [Maritimibacter dapengensis]
MFRILLSVLVILGFSNLALAQDRANAILVLDGSGSMWGQIDGVNKIVIARDVVGGLLDSLPEDQALGLMAYGHRTKGDCGDIELLAEPGTDRAALAAAVNGISPVGKTPLSAAVIQAAEALKYSEEVATVILVSDGIETCDYDPCEVGRQLEQTGVGFTAHVIGFDVADPAARAQLQCLADETGGTFRTADDAGELADALTEVAAAPAPEPQPAMINITFRATDGEGGPVITDGLIWSISAGDATLADGADEASPAFTLEEATEGTATVLRLVDEASAEATYSVTTEGQVVVIALPEYAPPATVEAPASAPAGSLVDVTFTGPRGGGDYISSAREGMKPGFYDEYANVTDAEGDTLTLRMPPVAGTATISYVLGDGRDILGSTTIEVTPLDITLTVPEAATVGTAENIVWTGPDYTSDYITVSKPDDSGYEAYTYTNKGSPLSLDMPTEEGTYELRYVLSASREIAARSETFEVSPATVSVEGPVEAIAGSTIEVTWEGPDADADYIAISRVDDDSGYETYAYTKGTNPLEVKTPIEPGDYEIRYILSQGRKILAATPLALTEVSATVSGPASATVGTEIEVTWEGPDYKSDYIGIGKAGEPGYVTYTYTSEGSPMKIEVPGEPGDYELRYIPNADQSDVLARAALTVEAAQVTLSAPASVVAGSQVAVDWTGPDTKNDWLDISTNDDTPNDYEAYEYTKSGSPAQITAPAMPGEYFVRYVLSAQPRQVIATRPITVTDVTANVSGVIGDERIDVTWEGPNYQRDYVVVAEPGAAPNKYIDYVYAREGGTGTLDLPETPGEYELRYIFAGTETRILTTTPITIE